MPSGIRTVDEGSGARTVLATPGWSFLDTLAPRLATGTNPVSDFRAALAEGDRELARRFHADEPVEALVRDRAALVDALVTRAWSLHMPGRPHRPLALVAVGGYGRGELLPCSDVDVMVLLPQARSRRGRRRSSAF